jgi:hypothetical protein
MDDDNFFQYLNGALTQLSQSEVEECIARKAAWESGASARLAEEVRMERDKLLQESDCSMLRSLESGESSTELREYRQALRDIPQQPDFPNSISWPHTHLL